MRKPDAANAPTVRRFGVLGNANFRKLWLASAGGAFGDQFAALGLSVTGILVLHATAFQVALLVALNRIAYLIIGIPAGVWVDRWSKRPVLLGCSVLRLAAISWIPLAHALHVLAIGQLMAVAATLSVAGVFFNTAHTSILPVLVGRTQVSEANARLQTGETTMQVIGPGAAGVALQIVAAPVLYVVSGVCALAASLFIGTLRLTETSQPAHEREPFWVSARSGLTFIWRMTVLRTLLLTNAAINVGAGAYIAAMPLFALRAHHLTGTEFSIVIAVGAIGGIAGSLLGLKTKNRWGELRVVVATTCLLPAAFLPLAFIGLAHAPAAVMISLSELLDGGIMVISAISAAGLRALVTPQPLMGRVAAGSRFISLGAVPVGALLSGLIAGSSSSGKALAAAAGFTVLAALIIIGSPLRRHRTLPQQWATGTDKDSCHSSR